jgi:uridylate kinase
MSDTKKKFKRVVLKLSGEALREIGSHDNISPEIVERIAKEIAVAHEQGVEIAIVVGGGNFWRGASASARGMDRATADYVGMLATVMNALAVQSAIEEEGVSCIVQSAIEMKNVAEPFIRRKAYRQLSQKYVVILKATMVDGIYTADPKKDPSAVRYETVSYDTCINDQLAVMDSTAFALCKENNIPIMVFDLSVPGNITKAIMGEKIGTVVTK